MTSVSPFRAPTDAQQDRPVAHSAPLLYTGEEPCAPTLRHDHRHRGFPVHYFLASDIFDRNLLGAPVYHFNFLHPYHTDADFMWYDNGTFRRCNGAFDPPNFRRIDLLVVDNGARTQACRASVDGFVPVRPPGFRLSPPMDSPSRPDCVYEAAKFTHILPDVQRLPDTFCDTSEVDAREFRKYHFNWNVVTRRADRQQIVPRVDRCEELLKWAEERAAANDIAPPYVQPGFEAASVLPPRQAAAEAARRAEAIEREQYWHSLAFPAQGAAPPTDDTSDSIDAPLCMPCE